MPAAGRRAPTSASPAGVERAAGDTAALIESVRRCWAELEETRKANQPVSTVPLLLYVIWHDSHPEEAEPARLVEEFAGWQGVLREAGLPHQRGPGPKSLEAVRDLQAQAIADLQRAHREHGAAAGAVMEVGDYQPLVKPLGLTPLWRVEQLFGTWTAGLRAAGLSSGGGAAVEAGAAVEELIRSVAEEIGEPPSIRRFNEARQPVFEKHRERLCAMGLSRAWNARRIANHYPGGWVGALQAAGAVPA